MTAATASVGHVLGWARRARPRASASSRRTGWTDVGEDIAYGIDRPLISLERGTGNGKPHDMCGTPGTERAGG
jgi:hypothetical protein